MDINKVKNIHFTGIKGVGMTALALYAKQMGLVVTGSDVKELFVTDKVLKKANIKWKVGFSNSNISKQINLLVTTGAHGGLNNPEVVFAQKKGISVITQGEALAEFSMGKNIIAVCGVGGKSTTTALIATILTKANRNPSYTIGVGEIFPLGSPGNFDKEGRDFICEADEFVNSPGIDNRPKFLFLDPKIVIVTNIEHDHPDIYPSLTKTKQAFMEFFKKIPNDGLLIANIDNKNIKDVLKKITVPVTTYGFSKDADWRLEGYQVKNQQISFNLLNKTRKVGILSPLPGKYNASNIAASHIVCSFLGVTETLIKKGVLTFLGTKRRFEKITKLKNGALIYDDYAHHPQEIKAVLIAAREFFPKRRIVSVFQPHTYSRTKALFGEFAKAFGDADIVCFMDIYSSAREKKDETVSSEKLAQRTKSYNKEVFYIGNHNSASSWLKKNLKSNDLLLTMGAGDIFYLHTDFK